MTAAEIIQRARDIRLKLRRPPNAVFDRGIDLRRGRNPYPATVPAIKPSEIPQLKARVLITEKEREAKRVKIDTILKAVSLHFRIGINDLKGKSRIASVTYPRHLAVYLACKHTKMTYSAISRIFSRDHTTTLYVRDKIAAQIAEPLVFYATAKAIIDIEESIFGDHNRPSVATEPKFNMARDWAAGLPQSTIYGMARRSWMARQYSQAHENKGEFQGIDSPESTGQEKV